jgi:hypothetical protein
MAGKKNNLVMLACGFMLVVTLIIGPVSADTMTWEDATNRLGNDYDSLVPGSPGYDGTAESCRDYCLNQSECKAATWVEMDQSCWLKEIVPPATTEDGLTSFVRVTSAPTVSPPVTPLATAPVTLPPTQRSPGFELVCSLLGCLIVLMKRRSMQ